MKSSCEGRVVDIDHTAHKYQIEFKDPDTLKFKTAWFKVDDVTSLTKEEENKRQRMAQEQSNVSERLSQMSLITKKWRQKSNEQRQSYKTPVY